MMTIFSTHRLWVQALAAAPDIFLVVAGDVVPVAVRPAAQLVDHSLPHLIFKPRLCSSKILQ